MSDDAVAGEMRRMEALLDKELGFHWWKRYVAAAFWSNVSTPVNLAITLFTALTTAQTTTDNLLPRAAYVNISIATLVLSVLNTFFRPHEQLAANTKVMGELEKLGNTFESTYYSSSGAPEDVRRRLDAYMSLRGELEKYVSSVSIDTRNFFTDLIHLSARGTALRAGREGWLYPYAAGGA